jgi:hypothetical protein
VAGQWGWRAGDKEFLLGHWLFMVLVLDSASSVHKEHVELVILGVVGRGSDLIGARPVPVLDVALAASARHGYHIFLSVSRSPVTAIVFTSRSY